MSLVEVNRLLEELAPDLIVITGDFTSYTTDKSMDDLVPPLAALSAADGVLAVLGNHDHWTNPEAVRQVLAQAGIHEIGNRVYTLTREDAVLHIAGVDDFNFGQADLEAVLAQIPATGPAIMLAHEPDFADFTAQTGRFALQLSGHTHGGQIVLPRVGPILLPYFGRKYPSGLYRVNGMLQYTNRGLGTSSVRQRINCPQEITLFTLRAPV